MRTFSGFTLIEVMIVVAICGILAAVALPFLTGKGKDSTPSTSFFAGGVQVVEECRGGVKYMITNNAITVMMDSQGLPFPC